MAHNKSYTVLDGRREDPNPFEDTVKCARCGEPIGIGGHVIYRGDSYHERCIPDEARKVATEVIAHG